MTTPIIIIVCVMVLIASVFDISSRKTKIPTVVLLLILGWSVKQLTTLTGAEIPNRYF